MMKDEGATNYRSTTVPPPAIRPFGPLGHKRQQIDGAKDGKDKKIFSFFLVMITLTLFGARAMAQSSGNLNRLLVDFGTNQNHNNVAPTSNPLDEPRFHFCSYGNDKFKEAKIRIANEAKSTGWFSTVNVTGPEDLPRAFVEKHKTMLKLKRGGGYWIWKHFIIDENMKTLREGDFLVFNDAGCKINSNGEERFGEYVKAIQESPYDMVCFKLRRPEYQYTTERLFEAFGVAKNNLEIRESPQLVGGILVMRNGPHYRKWMGNIKRVLEMDPWLITDKYNQEAKMVNSSFVDNRHDQSLTSVSAKLVGCVEYPDDTYPPGKKDMPFWASRMH